jgi:serine/threonine protein kinase
VKTFFGNLFGKKQPPLKIQERNELARQNESQSEAEEFFKIGDLIGGEFEVVGYLGKGGFGLVYRARHCETGAEFALKTFRDEFLDDSKARDAFKKEALLWVNLENHPFILAATVVLEISGRLFDRVQIAFPEAQRFFYPIELLLP